MADNRVVEILGRRIVRIGHEVFPLANISRVRTLQVARPGKLAPWYPLRGITILVVVTGAIAAIGLGLLPRLGLSAPFDVGQVEGLVVAVVGGLAGLRVAWLLCVVFYRVARRPRYTLVLETGGTQHTVLSGTDPAELDRVKWEIVQAVQHPPTHDRLVHLSGDVVYGDKIARDKYASAGGYNLTYTS
jgi:uncharacterized protein DUF6232